MGDLLINRKYKNKSDVFLAGTFKLKAGKTYKYKITLHIKQYAGVLGRFLIPVHP